MTGRERVLAAVSHEEPDRVPVSPRIWAWMLDYYGDASLPTYLRCCDEFGFDAFWIQGSPTPNYIYSWPDNYDLPEVRVEQHRYRDGEYTVVERVFHTPAGPLTDRVLVPPAGGKWGIAPDPRVTERLIKTREDLERLRYILPPVCGNMSAYHQAEQMVGDLGAVELYVHGPLDCQAAEARGMEQLMVDYYDDYAFFQAQVDL
ncbi:MAG: hypothetical protein H5T86_14080, partial [Armatimonadetes bacterium]|nr:hypothetical protein [Armatimonadota bacterium]